MAESTLAESYNDLSGQIGDYFGFGVGAANGGTAWTTDQQNKVTKCLKRALQEVYFCGHPWSFLKPLTTLQLDSGQSAVDLPDDYGGMEGGVVVTDGTTSGWRPVPVFGEGQIDQRFADFPDETGWPQACCVAAVKGTTAAAGQRSRLRFWPTADRDYTLKVHYYLLPDYLNGALPYVYGGAQHARTFMAAALYAAELLYDNLPDGPMFVAFQRALQASQDMDRRQKPQHYGYNGDRSDTREQPGRWPWHNRGEGGVTFQGTQY